MAVINTVTENNLRRKGFAWIIGHGPSSRQTMTGTPGGSRDVEELGLLVHSPSACSVCYHKTTLDNSPKALYL